MSPKTWLTRTPGGFLVTHGVYTGTEDFKDEAVRRFMVSPPLYLPPRISIARADISMRLNAQSRSPYDAAMCFDELMRQLYFLFNVPLHIDAHDALECALVAPRLHPLHCITLTPWLTCSD